MSNATAKAIDPLLSTSSRSDSVRLDIQFSNLTLSIIASGAFGQSFDIITHAKEIICRAYNETKDILEYRSSR
jgi:hypothetical protein